MGRRGVRFLSLLRYDVQLVKARKEGYKKSFFTSLVLGLLYFIIFSTFALGFW